MINEGAEYALKVAAVDEQEKPVEALSASCADEAFRDRVCLRRTYRCPNDLDALAAEDSVEVGCEPAVAVTDQDAKRRRTPLQRPRELAGLLDDPGDGRIGRAAGQVDTWLPSSMKKSTYSRCSETVSAVNDEDEP